MFVVPKYFKQINSKNIIKINMFTETVFVKYFIKSCKAVSLTILYQHCKCSSVTKTYRLLCWKRMEITSPLTGF